MNPHEYIKLFNANKSDCGHPANCSVSDHLNPMLDPSQLRNLYGRIMRGQTDEDFSTFSDEPQKRLSWVMGPEALASIVGMSVVEAMVHIGFDVEWIEKRYQDGTRFKLALFCSENDSENNNEDLRAVNDNSSSDCAKVARSIEPEEALVTETLHPLVVPATWDNINILVREAYGEDLWKTIEPFVQALKATKYDDLDPQGQMREISLQPNGDKFAHPEFMTPERLSALSQPTLYDIRAFYYHTVGCNYLFTGDGWSVDVHGNRCQREYMTINRPVHEIEGLVLMDLIVQEEDIREYRSSIEEA